MGFPRILSKNNKIYTKLGEFCLSGDSFWIVCHTCQEELQTQDAFWKHIQDEHNFLHGVAKQEHSRTSSYCLTDVEAAAATTTGSTQASGSVTAVSVPLALYHCAAKYSDEEQREVATAVELHEAQQQQQQQLHQQQQQQQQQQRNAAKEMAELHAVADAAAAAAAAIESSTRNSAGIDIKVEPSSLTLPPEMQAAAAAAAAAANTTIYHLSQVVPAPPPPPPTQNFVSGGTSSAINVSTTSSTHVASLTGTSTGQSVTSVAATTAGNAATGINASNPVMQQACNTLSISVVAAGGMPMLTGQELVPKDSNSTTASASSAVSSDDGERWYICDYGTCGLKFKYKSRMELHRVVHSKERRFNCDMCSASFKQSCNLSTHRKKKHALRGIKSEMLPQRF